MTVSRTAELEEKIPDAGPGFERRPTNCRCQNHNVCSTARAMAVGRLVERGATAASEAYDR
jgi:hypothetical protein